MQKKWSAKTCSKTHVSKNFSTLAYIYSKATSPRTSPPCLSGLNLVCFLSGLVCVCECPPPCKWNINNRKGNQLMSKKSNIIQRLLIMCYLSKWLFETVCLSSSFELTLDKHQPCLCEAATWYFSALPPSAYVPCRICDMRCRLDVAACPLCYQTTKSLSQTEHRGLMKRRLALRPIETHGESQAKFLVSSNMSTFLQGYILNFRWK